jgi:hypothetical protein
MRAEGSFFLRKKSNYELLGKVKEEDDSLAALKQQQMGIGPNQTDNHCLSSSKPPPFRPLKKIR